MTETELAEMLRRNPELVALDGTNGYGQINIEQEREPGTINLNTLPKVSEHDLQAAVIAECDRRSILRVEYGLVHAIPNGQYRQGQRMEPGLRPGVPDLFLPVARRGYHGFWIELKVKPNKPTEAQLDWLHKLKGEGYLCHVVWDSADEVMGLIESYLEGK